MSLEFKGWSVSVKVNGTEISAFSEAPDFRVALIKALNTKDFDDAVNKKNVDNWIINPSVHYNEWARFSRNDFQPVVAAYKEFISLFKCNECYVVSWKMQSTL